MKHKKATASAGIAAVILLALIVAGQYFGLLTFRSATRIGFVETGGSHSWSARYTMLDGIMQKTLSPTADTMTVTVETKTGALSVRVEDDSGVAFDRSDMGSGTCTVLVSGRTKITVQGDHHSGSFAFSFGE